MVYLNKQLINFYTTVVTIDLEQNFFIFILPQFSLYL